MADYIVRAPSVFVEGTKVGQFSESILHWIGNDEALFGDNGGQVVYSQGVQQTTLDCDAFEPITGLDFDLDTAMLNKTDLNISLGIVNGRILQMMMRVLSVEHKGSIKPGTLMGKFTLGGSAPTFAPAS